MADDAKKSPTIVTIEMENKIIAVGQSLLGGYEPAITEPGIKKVRQVVAKRYPATLM
jgi:hypothetical protein